MNMAQSFCQHSVTKLQLNSVHILSDWENAIFNAAWTIIYMADVTKAYNCTWLLQLSFFFKKHLSWRQDSKDDETPAEQRVAKGSPLHPLKVRKNWEVSAVSGSAEGSKPVPLGQLVSLDFYPYWLFESILAKSPLHILILMLNKTFAQFCWDSFSGGMGVLRLQRQPCKPQFRTEHGVN